MARLWQESASRLGRQSKENHLARREYPGVYPYPAVGGRTLYRTLYTDSNRRQRQKRGFTSPSAAAKFRARMQVRAERGELRITRETFAEHFEAWPEGYHRASKRTRDGYRAAGERRLKPFFGPMRLSAIDVQTVRNCAAEMVELVQAGELAPKTVNNTLSCLSTGLEDAVALHKIPSNPWEHIAHLPGSHIERDWLRRSEIARYLLSTCCGTSEWRRPALPIANRFRDRRAVVTGAASGIGRAVAERLLSENASVLGIDVDESGLSSLEAAGADILVANLASGDDRAAVIERAKGCDYLVNSAGIIRLQRLADVTVEDWRAQFTVNAEAPFFLMQGIGPTMTPGGAIVNLSSTSAKTGTTIEAASYAATKAALLSFTRAFAFAFADRTIRVNAILPGIVDTPMQDKVLREIAPLHHTSPEKLDAQRLGAVWLNRSGSPEECAGVICFLLSDEANYMTGQGINFSGGLVTW